MPRTRINRLITRLALLAGGTTLLLNGCDPTLQSTVEDGVISLSTSFLTSFLQAFFQVLGEANMA